MDGQLDGIFLAGSLPHEFISLIVTSFICSWLIISLSLFVQDYQKGKTNLDFTEARDSE